MVVFLYLEIVPVEKKRHGHKIDGPLPRHDGERRCTRPPRRSARCDHRPRGDDGGGRNGSGSRRRFRRQDRPAESIALGATARHGAATLPGRLRRSTF